jgi:Mg2+/Co2+ transporter CorB
MQTLRDLRSDPHRLLVTILVGNNVVNVAIASATTALLIEYLPTGSAVSVATVVASFVVLIFGEIVPKSYGLGHPTGWALRVAGPIRIVERVLYPLVIVFDVITRHLNARIGGETEIEKPYVDEE